jgi:hypothetical protein
MIVDCSMLTDEDLLRLARGYREAAAETSGLPRVRQWALGCAQAVMAELEERQATRLIRGAEAWLEAAALNDDGPGELLGPCEE